MVASDRLSAFDVDHGRADPRQGRGADADGAVLVRAARRTSCPNHLTGDDPESVVAADEREQVRGRSMLVKRLKPLPVEAVVRGYLAGSGWKEYQETRPVCGVPLPPGLKQRVEAAAADLHARHQGRGRRPRREHRLRARGRRSIGAELAARIRDIAIRLYSEAAAIALAKGIIIADTKFEFGLDDDGHADPDGRGAHARLLALLAGRGLPAVAGREPAELRQAVRARLAGERAHRRPALGQDAAGAAPAGGRDREDGGEVPRARYAERADCARRRAWSRLRTAPCSACAGTSVDDRVGRRGRRHACRRTSSAPCFGAAAAVGAWRRGLAHDSRIAM